MAGYDQLFKGLFRTFFEDFLLLVSPWTAGHLDASRATFLDKEFFTHWPQGHRRELDLLARVPWRQDAGRTVLIHVEIEARARPGIGLRLRSYRNQIQSFHEAQVISVVVFLSHGRPGVHVETLTEDLFDVELGRFRYISFGVAGCRAEEYLARPEPLSWGLAALMQPGSWSRAVHKRACLKRIAGTEMDDIRKFLLVNCVETYLELESHDAAEYDALRARDEQNGTDGNEEEHALKIAKMTWADKIRYEALKEGQEQGRLQGREEGRQEGLEQGARRVLLRQLGLRFGPLPDAVRQRVETIQSVEALTQLSDRVLVARSLAEMGLS